MIGKAICTLAALLAVDAAPAQEVTFEELKAMPADRLADRLLPAGHPPMARIAFYAPGLVWGGDISSIEFFSVATPLGTDFCQQQSIGASITPVPVKAGTSVAMPSRVGELQHYARYRYRPAGATCDAAETFFTVRPGASRSETPPALAFTAVRLLGDALRQAKRRQTGQALPFRFACRDALLPTASYYCGPLAALDMGQFDSVSVAQTSRGAQKAEIHFHIEGNLETSARLTMRAGRITGLRIDRGTVVY